MRAARRRIMADAMLSGRRFPPEPLTREEMARLLAACGADTWLSLRNRALLALLHRAGLRINEALWLAPKDVDLEAGAIRVLRGKGGRSRTVGIDPGGAAIVQEWMERRDALGLKRASPLLCTWSGGRLHAGSVRRTLQRLADEAGIEKRVHPHGLRHTHAAELREEGMDIGIISKQLGHRSIATTAVVEAMRGRGW